MHRTQKLERRCVVSFLPIRTYRGFRGTSLLLALVALFLARSRPAAFVSSSPLNWGLWRITAPDLAQARAKHEARYVADGTGVNVYIIGSGVLSTHKDFGGRVTYEGDFCTGSQRLSTAEVDPDNFADGHETHVAGYATGARSGVAKGAHIFSLRTTWHDEHDRTNGGPACVNGGQNGAVAAAFTWIKDHGRHPGVINFSGGHGTSDIQSAIQKAIAANFVVT